MSAGENKAVFLSYASQDADAVRRIADALRAAGVEVWFDQNELVGGDAWDAKIRKQIAECASFVPVISAATQARREGYFRIEWRLAAQRTHAMVDDTPFLLPVVLDDTRDTDAKVPPEFRAVQWTKLPGAREHAAFVTRVKHLLDLPAEAAAPHFNPPDSPRPRIDRGNSPPDKWVPLHRFRTVAFGGTALVVLSVALWSLLPSAKKFFSPSIAEELASPAGSKPVSELQQQMKRAPTVPARGAKSIVVLPFENLSDDKESGFFADGMQDDVISNLFLIRELSCVPRATAMTYRGTKKTSREIADELGVAFVLTGTVRRAGEKVRITGTLINGRADEAIWTKSYDKELTNVFGIQSELAQAIAAELKTTLSPEERSLVSRRATEDPAAYDLFLKARQERNNATGGGKTTLDRQIAWLEGAVARDPAFATAWAYLGRAYGLYYRNNIDHSPARLELARNAIDTALRLAPDTPEVLLNVGDYYYYCFRDYARATECFERAGKLQPNGSQAPFNLANVQRCQRRWLEAWANYQKAIERDPAFIDGVSQLFETAWAGRRYEDARRAGRRIAELLRAASPAGEHDLPNEYDLYVAMMSFYESGSTAEVDALLRRIEPDPRAVDLVRFLRVVRADETGDNAEVVRLDAVRPFTSPYGVLRVAVALINLGQRDAAIARIGNIPDQLRAQLTREPDNDTVWGNLSRLEAVLGHKEEALRCAREGMKRLSVARDAWSGVYRDVDLAFVYAWTGDTARAIESYAQLLSIPVSPRGSDSLAVHSLKRGVWYAPLRGNAQFEALLNDPKNNAPLF